MHISRSTARPWRATGLVAATLAASLTLAACGGSGDGGGGDADSGGDVTLKVSLFGTFGYEESGLFDEYEASHPGVTIEYDSVQQEDEYWPALQTRLNAGSGVADIQGIEVARIRDVVTNQADKWVDLKETSAADQLSKFPEWKTAAATTDDGKVLGMGTDIGPMAICYRTDLLGAAGLPTEPTALAAQMGTWEDYVGLGAKFQASAPAGTAWTDAASGLYNSIISTESTIYYDDSGELIWDTNPAVRSAFDLAAKAAGDGLTANVQQFSPEWNQGFVSGSFATLACPAWMIGYIKGQAGDAGSGLWNVADLPGGAGGNWGGSYLAIPAASEHQEEAAELVTWLTAGEQQAKVFENVGNFPSNMDAIAAIGDVTDPYFNGAPIGAIFGAVAEAAPTQILGEDDGVIKNQLSRALDSVAANNVPPAEAWDAARADIANEIG
jgi:cellobiose transport system substrate-binding protein